MTARRNTLVKLGIGDTNLSLSGDSHLPGTPP